jgi:hypothetical protein
LRWRSCCPLLGLASARSAYAASGDCTTSGTTVTCTVTYTGAAQTWSVPDGVTQATFTVYGAQSGSIDGFGTGGGGGATTATLPATAGQNLQIIVGGQGVMPPIDGGFNGERDRGAGGGLTGADGADGIGGEGGGGASQTAGGTGGSGVLSCTSPANGASRSFGVGGAAGFAAGGGGGGYYGGGRSGGGGGGSGFGPAGATFEAGVRSGNGQVIISYSTDSSAPTASPSQSPAANANGWNKSEVTVTSNWADAGSGIDSATSTTSSTSSSEGAQTLSASCADTVGNTWTVSGT